MKKLLILGVLSLLLAACETYTSLEDNTKLKFMSADQNFRFFNNAFPKGTSFEYVQTTGGKHAVWVNTNQASTIAGGMGAPVAMLSVQNKNGMILDADFCTTGEQLVHSIGITTIHPWDGYSVRKLITRGVCFNPIQ